jgi:hypothetical protein
MTLTIDGVDMTPYIAHRGVKWQRSDLDAPNSGRCLDGRLIRNRVASKVRLDITCIPLPADKARIVLTAIMPEWVTVTYTDPQLGMDVTKTMYSNNNPASFLMRRPDGTEYWDGITFPLIER